MTTDRELNPNAQTATKSRSHIHRHTSSSSRKKWIKILATTTALSLFIIMGLIILALMNSREIEQLATRNKKQTLELQQLRPQVIEQAKQITELVQNRLPTLQMIQFDKVTQLEHEYLKNIVFTLTGKARINRYEFRITAYNRGLSPIHPEFKIIFFNHLGIQLQELQLGIDEKGIPMLDPMEPSESRSFSASIKLSSDDEQPRYFQIKSRPSQNITFMD